MNNEYSIIENEKKYEKGMLNRSISLRSGNYNKKGTKKLASNLKLSEILKEDIGLRNKKKIESQADQINKIPMRYNLVNIFKYN